VTIAPIDLAIRKRVSPNPVVMGQPASYTLEISNPGSVGSQATVVRDQLPPDVHLTNISYAPSDCGWTSNQSGQQLVFWRTGIPAFKTCIITLDFVAPHKDDLSNKAQLWDSLDTALGNNTSYVSPEVMRPPLYDLKITNYALNLWGPVQRGAPLLYVLYVENLGPGSTSGPIRIVDTFKGNGGLVHVSLHPLGFQFLTNGGLNPTSWASPGSLWTCTFVNSLVLQRRMECVRNAPMPQGGEVIWLWAKVHRWAGHQISSTAQLIAPDADWTNNKSIVTSPVP
jgi:uncharacterized repeat protein (TIGR01451 family)